MAKRDCGTRPRSAHSGLGLGSGDLIRSHAVRRGEDKIRYIRGAEAWTIRRRKSCTIEIRWENVKLVPVDVPIHDATSFAVGDVGVPSVIAARVV